MPTIGLKDLYYAPITQATEGADETFETPVKLAKVASADLSVENVSGQVYYDDALDDSREDFKDVKISLVVNDIGSAAAAALLGATADAKGGIAYSIEDKAPYVAIGFRSLKSDGSYRYVWLYKVKFSVPAEKFATKGSSITYNSPTITGVGKALDKKVNDRHLYKYSVDSNSTGAETVVAGWFTAVVFPPTSA